MITPFATPIPTSMNRTSVTIKARRGRSRDNAEETPVPLSPADRETVEDLKAKKRARPSKSKAVNHHRPDYAARFREVIGERVDIAWGVGSQQSPQVTSGTVKQVTDTYVLIHITGKFKEFDTFIPFGFIVRWGQ